MTMERPASWFALTADTGAMGAPLAGKHAARLLDSWARNWWCSIRCWRFAACPIKTTSPPAPISTTAAVNWSATSTRHCAPAATPAAARREFSAIAAELQSANVRSATQLKLVMLSASSSHWRWWCW
jgi:hypothetical protein